MSNFTVEGGTLVRFLGPSCGDIAVPPDIDRIGEGAFAGRSDLRSVAFCEGVETICRGAFKRCSALSSVKLPEGTLKSIGSEAFRGCSSLASVELPASLREIFPEAFSESGLMHATLPAHVGRLGSGIYRGSAVRRARVDGHEVPSFCFSECASLESVDLGADVAEIGMFAFSGCVSLQSANIPERVEDLGRGCFAGCRSLGRARVPAGVRRVAPGAFRGCEAACIVIEGVPGPEVGDRAFEGVRQVRAAKGGFVPQERALGSSGRTAFVAPWLEAGAGVRHGGVRVSLLAGSVIYAMENKTGLSDDTRRSIRRAAPRVSAALRYDPYGGGRPFHAEVRQHCCGGMRFQGPRRRAADFGQIPGNPHASTGAVGRRGLSLCGEEDVEAFLR